MKPNNLVCFLAAIAISFLAFVPDSRGAGIAADEKALIKIEDE